MLVNVVGSRYKRATQGNKPMKQKTFAETNVVVTLLGAEWFAVIAKLAGKPLSDSGEALYLSASRKMQAQIIPISERLKEQTK
jgi:hypothetical protein